jgi:chromosome segregation ATPase
MPPDEQGTAATAGKPQRLEDEVENARTRAAKFEQQLEELRVALSRLTDRLHQQEGDLANANVQIGILTQAQQEVHALQTVTTELRAEQERARGRLEEVTRHEEVEDERLRNEQSERAKAMEDLERKVAALQERQVATDEIAHHYQDDATLSSQQTSAMQQRLEEMDGRLNRNTEAVNRLEQRLSELETATENAVRAAETATEKTQVLTDAVRRDETELEVHTQRLQELTEMEAQAELSRSERQRLETRFAETEEILTSLSNSREEHQHLLAALEGKHHGYEGRLDSLSDRLNEYREQLADHLQKLTRTQQQLRRRQIGDMEREIKDLEQHGIDLFQE